MYHYGYGDGQTDSGSVALPLSRTWGGPNVTYQGVVSKLTLVNIAWSGHMDITDVQNGEPFCTSCSRFSSLEPSLYYKYGYPPEWPICNNLFEMPGRPGSPLAKSCGEWFLLVASHHTATAGSSYNTMSTSCSGGPDQRAHLFPWEMCNVLQGNWTFAARFPRKLQRITGGSKQQSVISLW